MIFLSGDYCKTMETGGLSPPMGASLYPYFIQNNVWNPPPPPFPGDVVPRVSFSWCLFLQWYFPPKSEQYFILNQTKAVTPIKLPSNKLEQVLPSLGSGCDLELWFISIFILCLEMVPLLEGRDRSSLLLPPSPSPPPNYSWDIKYINNVFTLKK